MYPHDEAWLRKISRIDENSAINGNGGIGSNGSARKHRSVSPGGSTKKPKRKSSVGIINPHATADTVEHEKSHTYRSSSVSNSDANTPVKPQSVPPTTFLLNPFAFNSLSLLMSNQDQWRKDPKPDNVDFSQFKAVNNNNSNVQRGREIKRETSSNGTSNVSNDSIWVILLMIEDEFARAAHSHFQLLHPSPDTVCNYLSLYRSARFSDHLLGKWVISNGMYGPFKDYVPLSFLSRHSINKVVNNVAKDTPSKGELNSSKIKIVQDIIKCRQSNDLITDSLSLRTTPARPVSQLQSPILPFSPIQTKPAEVEPADAVVKGIRSDSQVSITLAHRPVSASSLIRSANAERANNVVASGSPPDVIHSARSHVSSNSQTHLMLTQVMLSFLCSL